jgi:hypothetical protein
MALQPRCSLPGFSCHAPGVLGARVQLDNYSDEELAALCRLRAIEWSNWPAFLSIAAAPILFVFCGITPVLLAIAAASLAWRYFRVRWVSLPAAIVGCTFEKLKYVTIPVGCCVLLWRHQWGSTLFAAFTPLYMAYFGTLSPSLYDLLEINVRMVQQSGIGVRDIYAPDEVEIN